MLVQFSDLQPNGTPAVKLIGQYDDWTLLHIQVIGASVLRIARNVNTLATPGPNGIAQGLQISGAITGGITSIWWIGTMYGTGSAPNTLAEIIELNHGVPGQPKMGYG